MRTITKMLFGFIAISAMASCKKENSIPAIANSPIDEIRSAPPGGNYWSPRADFVNDLTLATSFVINGKGYVFGGYLGTGTITNSRSMSNRLFEFDPLLNTWTEKAPLPSAGRYGLCSFVINNKGYVVGGSIGDPSLRGGSPETWEYNPATNSWRARRSLSEGRTHATAFAINGKGYVAMGATASNLNNNDLLEYDPVADTWIAKSRLAPGFLYIGRIMATSFVANGKAYIGLGRTNGISTAPYFNDFWEYNPLANSWLRKADYPGGHRSGSVSFTIDNIGYVGTGNGDEIYYKDFWAYHHSTNSWDRIADLPGGSGRIYGIGFAIGSHGYVGMGVQNSHIYKKDFYRYNRSTGFTISTN